MGTAANAIVFSVYNNSAVFNNSLGGVALQTYSGPNADRLYMRHSSFRCSSREFVSNNYDFAWLFYSTSTNGIFTIYNWYGRDYYLDIVNNNLQITNNTPPRQWQVIQVSNPPSGYTLQDFVVYTADGTDLPNQPMNGTVAQCQNACDTNSNCLGFSRQTGTNPNNSDSCWLKQNLSNRIGPGQLYQTYVKNT